MSRPGEKEAVWVAESDDHLPGRVSAGDRTDQRCPYCGRWFDSRGSDAHIDNCRLRESDYYEFNPETERVEFNVLAFSKKTESDEYLSRWLRVIE